MTSPLATWGTQTPTFSIKADGSSFDVSRVLRIEVTDAAGIESDELKIVLDDGAPHIETPREGAQYEISLGYREQGLPTYIGSYKFEELERNGFERTLTLFAKGADHSEGLKEPKSRAWEGNVKKVVSAIASEHDLKPAIADALAQINIAYMAQTEESDQNFLTRLAKKIGAVIAFKDRRILVTERGSGRNVSGDPMPTLEVVPTKLLSQGAYHVRLKPRARHSKVIARWQDQGAGKLRQVIAKVAEKGPSITLREVFQNEEDATKAADAKAKQVRAGEGEITLELVGDPTVRAETPIRVVGVAPDADGDWISSTITHVWDFSDGGGATTTIEAEFGSEEKDDKKGSKKKERPSSPNTSAPADTEYVSVLDR